MNKRPPWDVNLMAAFVLSGGDVAYQMWALLSRVIKILSGIITGTL
jgi:hypothetical protein